MEKCISVKNLEKTYGNRKVVDGISFEVKKGEIFGLLGHNGAGKSTSIEMILGLKKRDNGDVKIFGEEPGKKNKKLFEKIGVQLQASNYQSSIKVCEILEQMSSLYKNPADYHELLNRFKLDKFEKETVSKLSGGERQRLSVALALLPKPELVFLDELTTGLDVEARREVWKILDDIKAQGTTIVLTTHYMEEAERLCDRLLIIKNGKTIAEGTVKEIIAKTSYDRLEDAYLYIQEKEEETV